MYLTPAELPFLFYSIILTNPIVDYMSKAKPRREANSKLVKHYPLNPALSDGHDKPFCTKAITIIDNFKKPLAIPIIGKSQFFKAISVIDKLSPINFSDKCCGKFLTRLTTFFLQVTLKNVFPDFLKKREQFTDSAVA